MIRRITIIFLLAFSVFQLQAENVFIETWPSGSSVYFDGKLLEKQTPLRLENITPGKYSVRLIRKDYNIAETELTVEEGKTALLQLPLDSEIIVHRFSGEDQIIFNGAVHENSEQIFRIPEGLYDISRKNGIINIKPVYKHNWAIKALYIGLPVFAVATAALVIQDYIENDGDSRMSPTTIAGATITFSAGSILSGLLINRKRYYANLPFGLADPPPDDEAAKEYYDKGEAALAEGDFNEAQNWYLLLMQNQPDTRYYPHALYKMAKIHYLGGNDSLALAELTLLEDSYPTTELYDKTCKTLADVLYRTGKYAQALAYLEKMEFLDPLFSREEIDRYIETIRELID